jgi:nitrogenase molybdenum-iron protein NifN
MRIRQANKAAATNPLKMSQPLGAALAFLGIDRCLPVFHGAQGCTAFGLVVFVRHFRESIPLQTTALDQIQTILGGYDNLAEALVTIHGRTKPKVIGVMTTGLTETKGEDMEGAYSLFSQAHPEVLADTKLVFVNTPDFKGGFEDGFAAAVKAMVERLVVPAEVRKPRQVNILAGSHLTPADIEELRDLVEAFGLDPIILPDISTSLGGRQTEEFPATTLGGTPPERIAAMGSSACTLAIGEHMRAPAATLELNTGVPYRLFRRVTGLEATDRFVKTLMELSGREPPARIKRQREHLVDALLDGHFFFARKRVAVALEPDLLYAYTALLNDLGCEVIAAVSPTASPVLERVKAWSVMVGDHEDLETVAGGADVILSNAHARQTSARLGVPLLRVGLPTFDRLGTAHRLQVGYRGTRDVAFELGNHFIAQSEAHGHASSADEHEEATHAAA